MYQAPSATVYGGGVWVSSEGGAGAAASSGMVLAAAPAAEPALVPAAPAAASAPPPDVAAQATAPEPEAEPLAPPVFVPDPTAAPAPVAAVPAPIDVPAPPAPEPPPPAFVTIVGRVATSGGVSLPGVTVRLGGLVQATTVTDANGAYRFRVPPGNYSLAPAPRSSSLFTPDVLNLSGLAADAIHDFTCSGSCTGGPLVLPNKELVITDPSVVGDARASNASAGQPWSFRFLVEQMTPAGVDPADFIGAWLGQLEVPDHSVNGFPVDVRNTSALRALWPTGAGKRLDLSRAPFRLLAITNRVDLHAAGNGEARFVYGVVDAHGVGRPMTVIFEFELPSRDAFTGAVLTRRDWAAKFHALGGLGFGDGYNTALQEITDLFTRRNTSPARPGGSSIAQVRSNEVLMGGPWQMREFHLSTANGPLALWLATTAQTPADAAGATGSPLNVALHGFVSASRVAIHGGYAQVPSGILGGQATENFAWAFVSPLDAAARHAFAGQTCNGCHFSEAGGLQKDGFYQVSPIADPGADGIGRLSSFLRLFELPRRALFLQTTLTCDGATCPAGAEPML
jgi:hypothetical protein